MAGQLTQEQRALLEAFVREVDHDPDAYPEPLRSQREASRDLAAAVLRASASGTIDDERDEIERLLNSASLWQKGLLDLPPGLVWELTAENVPAWRDAGRPGQVWIMWDAVPLGDRDTVLSYANMLRDLYLGHRIGGRPSGRSLKPLERAAVASLGLPLAGMDPQHGWKLMVEAGGWRHDERPDTDRAARRARSARWRRLIERAATSGHG